MSTLTGLDSELIYLYVHGERSDENADYVRNLIQTNPEAAEVAMDFAEFKQIEETPETPEEAEESKASLASLRIWLKETLAKREEALKTKE